MNKFAVFAPLALFLGLSMILFLGLDKDPSILPSALVDKEFPEFDLMALDDEDRQITREELLGDVTLVNVWASWCYACSVEHKMLNKLSDRGVKIVGLNYKDQVEDAMLWLENLGDPFVYSVSDIRGRLGLDLGVYGAPETFLVDAQGIIRYRRVGVIDERVWRNEFRDLYAELLVEAQ